MKFIPLEISDVLLIEPDIHRDPRGFFFESYQARLFSSNGIQDHFVQDNVSSSMKGVLRGLHYQIEPKAQAKLVHVVHGKVYDVAVDIRKHSKTFGKFVACILSADSFQILYIPTGFAHGFCVLEDQTEFIYKVSDFYSHEHERGIAWNDPEIGIPWPKLDCDYVLSDKDKKHPYLLDSLRSLEE